MRLPRCAKARLTNLRHCSNRFGSLALTVRRTESRLIFLWNRDPVVRYQVEQFGPRLPVFLDRSILGRKVDDVRKRVLANQTLVAKFEEVDPAGSR